MPVSVCTRACACVCVCVCMCRVWGGAGARGKKLPQLIRCQPCGPTDKRDVGMGRNTNAPWKQKVVAGSVHNVLGARSGEGRRGAVVMKLLCNSLLFPQSSRSCGMSLQNLSTPGKWGRCVAKTLCPRSKGSKPTVGRVMLPFSP